MKRAATGSSAARRGSDAGARRTRGPSAALPARGSGPRARGAGLGGSTGIFARGEPRRVYVGCVRRRGRRGRSASGAQTRTRLRAGRGGVTARGRGRGRGAGDIGDPDGKPDAVSARGADKTVSDSGAAVRYFGSKYAKRATCGMRRRGGAILF